MKTPDFTKVEIHHSDGTIQKVDLDTRLASHRRFIWARRKTFAEKYNAPDQYIYSDHVFQPSNIDFD